jgi:glycerophosphoryl diester phosphodiesterase
LLDTLEAHGVKTFSDLPTYIQSFEVENLRYLNREIEARGMDLPLIQLLGSSGQPYDVEAAGGDLTYDEMATPAGLVAIRQYADGVGPEKYHFVIPLSAEKRLDFANATTFVADAHAQGLLVHPFTFRAENRSLPTNLKGGADDPGIEMATGQSVREMQLFLRTGIDGFFTDQPDLGRAAVAAGPAPF